jgi:hypothetical protein
MGNILRIGFRHLESVRHQTLATLGSCFATRARFSLATWASEQFPEALPFVREVACVVTSHDVTDCGPIRNYAPALMSLMRFYEEAHPDPVIQRYASEAAVSTSLSDHAEEDHFGTRRGGSWDQEDFVLRAGLVFTMASLEFFERGVLRTLLKRAEELKESDRTIPRAGLSDFKDKSFPEGDPDHEQALKTAKERWDLLRSRFHLRQPQLPRELRDDRNDIAHSLYPVRAIFSGFLQAHYAVFKAMNDVAGQCVQKLGIDI